MNSNIGIMQQAVQSLFSPVDTSINQRVKLPGLESLHLSVFDIHYETVKDFGKSILTNLGRKETEVAFSEEIDNGSQMRMIYELEKNQEFLPVLPIKSETTRIEIKSS